MAVVRGLRLASSTEVLVVFASRTRDVAALNPGLMASTHIGVGRESDEHVWSVFLEGSVPDKEERSELHPLKRLDPDP